MSHDSDVIDYYDDLGERIAAAYVSCRLGDTAVDYRLKQMRKSGVPTGSLWRYIAEQVTQTVFKNEELRAPSHGDE